MEGEVDRSEATRRVLAAAERLYYARGINAVGMDEVRSTAGVSLKLLYQLFPSKECLVAAYLDERDERWRGRLRAHGEQHATDPRERLLAVFDWLGSWFAEPGFRGCAFGNAFGEVGSGSPLVLAAVQRHKTRFREYLHDLARAVPVAEPDALADQLLLLAEGAMSAAAILPEPRPDVARRARRAAAALLDAAAA
jgi:AcrR family transcriptional regulator